MASCWLEINKQPSLLPSASLYVEITHRLTLRMIPRTAMKIKINTPATVEGTTISARKSDKTTWNFLEWKTVFERGFFQVRNSLRPLKYAAVLGAQSSGNKLQSQSKVSQILAARDNRMKFGKKSLSRFVTDFRLEKVILYSVHTNAMTSKFSTHRIELQEMAQRKKF